VNSQQGLRDFYGIQSCSAPPPCSYNPPVSTDFLRFHHLSRAYGRLSVLRDLSGEVEAGQLMLITGTNGSGKSTLLRCLAGLLAPQKGSIECCLEGRTLDSAQRRLAVGYLAPDLEFYPQLSALENLSFFCRLRGVDPAVGKDLLQRLGLPPGRVAGALSSGMKQRLRWAWALLHRPALLLLDEPLCNLDEAGRKDVLRLLTEHLDHGLAIVASPDPLELPRVACHLHLDD
jgi:heme exporter protein A